MPDDIREPFRPGVSIEPPARAREGFRRSNKSGLSAAEFASLNAALSRLMAAGLREYEARRALDTAVREGMAPSEAADAELAWLISWH